MSYSIFKSLPREEMDGPSIRLSDGRLYSTKSKVLELVLQSNRFYAICVSSTFIDGT